MEDSHDCSGIAKVPGSSAWTSSSSDPNLTMAEESHPWIREVLALTSAGGIVIINLGNQGDIVIGVDGDFIKDVRGNIIKDVRGNIIKKGEKDTNYVAPRVAEIPKRSVDSQCVNTDITSEPKGNVNSKNVVFFGNAVKVFDLDDLLTASAELLAKGSFGTAYKAALDMGVAMAVKRLKEVTVSEMEFREKIEEIGNMDHVNLVPLRAYYYSRDEKLLLSAYMPMGSLFALLHGNRGSGRTPLNWEKRSGIAVGAARAITYLHSHGPTISHGNIKSSNILLTSSYEACVSDFCLAHFSSPSSTPNHISGYRAPEVTDSNKVTQKADVYSFGVLLLELLTGKPPTQALMNEEGVDLPRWVHSVVREEWTVEVLDLELLRYQNFEDKMVQLLQIAVECTHQNPDKRPSMAEVTSQIEELYSASLKHGQSMSTDLTSEPKGNVNSKNVVFFGNAVKVFDLDDLLTASAELLAKGTFGTAYKVALEMGVAMAVKRLKEVTVSEMEFREKIEEIGNMDHVNLVPLRAYYYSRDEKLLLSAYMPMGSLSALLHGNRGSGRTPLNWEKRSGIAVGAARAITYLHSHGPTISHGNIKSSNILLTSSYEACVSDFCLAHFSSPSSTPNHISGYRAPEVTDSNKVTQKADVYSFGVLLLELLTGKPPTQALTNEEGVDLPRWVHSVVREEWTVEVLDLELLRYQNFEDKMVQLLQIALECTHQNPDKRPSMAEVTSQIEELYSASLKHGRDENQDEVDDGISQQY